MPDLKRILVVEDDSGCGRLLKECLRSAGYEVVWAPDGLAALEAFDNVKPDLVTLDLLLPQVTGFRLIELFKQHRPEVPVVVISGMAFEEAEEVAVRKASDYLTKPFDLNALLDTVHYLLECPAALPAPTPFYRVPVLAIA